MTDKYDNEWEKYDNECMADVKVIFNSLPTEAKEASLKLANSGHDMWLYTNTVEEARMIRDTLRKTRNNTVIFPNPDPEEVGNFTVMSSENDTFNDNLGSSKTLRRTLESYEGSKGKPYYVFVCYDSMVIHFDNASDAELFRSGMLKVGLMMEEVPSEHEANYLDCFPVRFTSK